MYSMRDMYPNFNGTSPVKTGESTIPSHETQIRMDSSATSNIGAQSNIWKAIATIIGVIILLHFAGGR